MSAVIPPTISGAGPRVVRSSADALARFDRLLRAPATAPVRDALVEALTGLASRAEAGGEYAAAQSDVARATSAYLDGLGQDRGYGRSEGEGIENFRARVRSTPDVVTEEAIRTGVNAILAALGVAAECQVFDGTLDRWFVHKDAYVPTAIWHSYIGIGPSYPDRYLSGDALNTPGGATIPNSDPGGAWAFKGTLGRLFVVRLPVLDGMESVISYVWSGAAVGSPPVVPESVGEGMFVGQSVSPFVAAFVSKNRATTAGAYGAIVNFLWAIAGQGIRFTVWSDPRL